VEGRRPPRRCPISCGNRPSRQRRHGTCGRLHPQAIDSQRAVAENRSQAERVSGPGVAAPHRGRRRAALRTTYGCDCLCPVGEALVARIGADLVARPHHRLRMVDCVDTAALVLAAGVDLASGGADGVLTGSLVAPASADHFWIGDRRSVPAFAGSVPPPQSEMSWPRRFAACLVYGLMAFDGFEIGPVPAALVALTVNV
jgi:hypothetical protein